MEGIVSKRLGSRYRSGRSPDWLKFKTPEAPALSARLKRIGDDDYPQMQDAHLATALMCGATEWSK